jgi:hypothetical protein
MPNMLIPDLEARIHCWKQVSALCKRGLSSAPRLFLIGILLTAPFAAAQKIELSVDVSKSGPKIDRNIFGQFAEHLGHGVYEGIWVGRDSKIPNTRGIRNDVVTALKALKVPNVRWILSTRSAATRTSQSMSAPGHRKKRRTGWST